MTLAEFVARYGEKGYIVLKAIIEAARRTRAPHALGDFSYRDLKRILKEMGVDYNPSPLLVRLEREYGVIETSYRSSNQHWWNIIDRYSIEEVLREWEGRPEPDPEDPRVRMLRIQFYSLDPQSLLDTLTRLSRRYRMSAVERDRLRRFAFHELPLLVEFLERAKADYPDELADEIAMAESILELAEMVTSRAGGRGKPRRMMSPELEDALRRGGSEPL